MTHYWTADAINAAIAAGETVTAVIADLPRRGQPPRGVVVTVERAYTDGDRPSIRARGYRARFRAQIVSHPYLEG